MPVGEQTQQLDTGDLLEPWHGVAVTDARDELVGVTLNATYKVERLLGEGGMGRVYLAQHQRIAQKRVAVKVLRSQAAEHPQVLARFRREAEAAAAISHPNVMSVLDVGVAPNGMPYIVCEYLDGIDLADHLKRVTRLESADALELVLELCRALAAAHASGVIHRDLKPANVFLVGDFGAGKLARPSVKLLDFGLSRFDAGDGQQGLTTTGLIMGTPMYMAPEQARGNAVDGRADVYGLGAMLFTMLTGRPPFDAETPQATVLALLNSEPPRPRSLVPSIPAPVEELIERAMQKEPSARFADMAAFEAAALAALAAPPAGASSKESDAPGGVGVAPHPSAPSERRAEAALSAGDARGARLRLLLWLLATLLLALSAASVALSGVELATGHTLSKGELRLLALGLVGTVVTPALLWLWHVRLRVWASGKLVLASLEQLRSAALAGIVSYGLLVLASHFVDDFLLRVLEPGPLGPVGAAWRGWNLLLPAAALVTAVAVAWRRSLLSAMPPSFRRRLELWLVTALSAAIVTGIVRFGIVWRAVSESR
jgi:tRNA A-37 threonylcarbamoyl transferase component Bud32